MEINVALEPHPDYIKQARAFHKLYDLVDMNLGIESNKSSLAKERDRKCRFCNGVNPDVKFTKEAHLISTLVGNRSLFSDFECDDCNLHFGQLFENELASYLGISRSLTGTKGRDGIPTFKCADKILTIRSGVIQDLPVSVAYRADKAPGFFRTELEAGKTTFTYRKHPYTPISVYKAIYKWAISILSSSQMNNYELAIPFLSGKIAATSGCLLSGYTLPFNYCFPPHYFLFEKRDKSLKVHTHVAVFYFQNYILSCPILLNKEDRFLIKTETNIPLYPAMFTQFTDASKFQVNPFHADFFSDQKIADDREEITYMMNKNDLKNVARYDGTTKQVTQAPYNPSDIKSLIMMREENSEIKDIHAFYNEVKNYFS